MSDDQEAPQVSPFEQIRREQDGYEFWSARDLADVLGYASWQKFKVAVQRAELACQQSGQSITDHFNHTDKLIVAGKGARRRIEDVHLSRYACYLVVQNADPAKEIVALGQTYFAVQTRRMEQVDELDGLTDTQKRLYLRYQLTDHNKKLADTARQTGVIKPADFAIFQDHGYMGLYGGLRAKDIHARKGLKPKQEILDYMDSEELGANIFRATQTEAKLRREQIRGKEQANQAHFEMGQKVREFIHDVGGTMPEDLPLPRESIQELQQKEEKRIKRGNQLSMLDNLPEARDE